jgi:hypothetical protein
VIVAYVGPSGLLSGRLAGRTSIARLIAGNAVCRP